jgi:hypothetical protein
LQGVKIELTDSTAAEKLAQDPKGACIGGYLLAKQQKLTKLRANTQDYSKNITRFFAISARHARVPAHSDKTTFSVIIPDRVGTLVQVLQMIAQRGINLLNIKTLPVRAAHVFSEDFKDWFIIDVASSAPSTEFENLFSLFDNQRDIILSCKVLGSYAGTLPTEVAKRKSRGSVKRAAEDKRETYEKMIKKGESERVEFKSTLRYDLKITQVNKELGKAVAKTLAGFMNSDGGYLFIGVGDGGEIVGIEHDIEIVSKKSIDGFLAALYQIVADMLGNEFCQFLHPDFLAVTGKTICCVEVDVSTKAAWLADVGTHTLFIRAGNSTRPLDPKEANDYILSRFR